jgi:hypothetical protein
MLNKYLLRNQQIIYIYIYMYVYVCVYTYMYVYIYVHTRILEVYLNSIK